MIQFSHPVLHSLLFLLECVFLGCISVFFSCSHHVYRASEHFYCYKKKPKEAYTGQATTAQNLDKVIKEPKLTLNISHRQAVKQAIV